MTLSEIRDAVVEFVEWHGAEHEDGCPCDDTCDCEYKPFNDRINQACRALDERAAADALDARQAPAELPKLYRGHIDPDCEVYREVGAFCTCETPEEKAERARECAEIEAEQEKAQAPAESPVLAPTHPERTRDVLLELARWIRQPGNINRDDAVDEIARLLTNNAIAVMMQPAEPPADLKEQSAVDKSYPATVRKKIEANRGRLKVGQVWREMDKRVTNRRVRIIEIGPTHAVVANVHQPSLVTRIRIDRFKPGSTGFELVSG